MSPIFRLHLLLFPPACRICDRLMNPLAHAAPAFPYLCESCREDLPWKDFQYSCRCCGQPTAEPDRPRCPVCAGREHHLARVWCAFHYVEHIRHWILSLKYRRNEALAHMLGALLRHAGDKGPSMEEFDLMIPVPLHPRRLRQRGFNQAYLLAHTWRSAQADGAAPALRIDVLQRHRHTRPQVELPAKERAANVDAAFSLCAGLRAGVNAQSGGDADKPLAGQRVLLVDDLMTTGATLNACAAALRQAGAARVEAFVLARA